MKYILALLALFSLNAQAGNLFCVTGTQAGTLECSFWASIPGGWQSIDVPYAQLVPAGETRPLRIYDGFLRVDVLYAGSVSHSLLVESPTGSSKWKYPLAWMYDGDGRHIANINMSQPVTLSSGDELCFDHWNATTYSSGSFAINYIIGP